MSNLNQYQELLKANRHLESERLLLRPFSLDDTADVFEYASDDVVTKYLTWPTHQDLAQAEKTVREFYMEKPDIYAIELKAERKCIGCIDLRLCALHHKASFGYVLNRKFWNKNYMTEALQLLLELAFDKLNLNRVESNHYVGNEGSGRVMQKCGMRYEGFGRQEVLIKGIYHDVIHYAILREDWIRLKGEKLDRS